MTCCREKTIPTGLAGILGTKSGEGTQNIQKGGETQGSGGEGEFVRRPSPRVVQANGLVIKQNEKRGHEIGRKKVGKKFRGQKGKPDAKCPL